MTSKDKTKALNVLMFWLFMWISWIIIWLFVKWIFTMITNPACDCVRSTVVVERAIEKYCR